MPSLQNAMFPHGRTNAEDRLVISRPERSEILDFLDHPRVEITCQNHGFAVEAESLEDTTARLTHVTLNDGTVEGLVVDGAAFSVQYHPESGPGPHDSRYVFEHFHDLIDWCVPREVAAVPALGWE
jgi:gamma-glutamyl-gamma-aminobutyrate hydrolase PuuD